MPATKTKFGLLLFLTQWVVYSEAWFWSWSGTTTRLPQTLEYEGSGSPTGSGELPSEITTKAEGDMVHEGHGTPNIKQTWVLTTEDPQMSTVTPATLRETDDASESVTARISPQSTSEDNGVSLLQLIGDPPPSEISQVYGPDNAIGYVFGPDAKMGQLAVAHFPTPFYRDFSLNFHLKPTSNEGGVVFSITDSSQQVIVVGVKLSTVERQTQDVIFYYSETGSEQSYEAARFQVTSMTDTWTRFSISVRDDKVAFYFNCDLSPVVKRFERSPDDMELERGSGVFVGQTGGPDPERFLVCICFHPTQPNVVFYTQCHRTTDFSKWNLGDGELLL